MKIQCAHVVKQIFQRLYIKSALTATNSLKLRFRYNITTYASLQENTTVVKGADQYYWKEWIAGN